MCRLYGYTTKDPETTTGQLVEALHAFRVLAQNGCVPCGFPEGHMDGWGIVAYKETQPVIYVRSDAPAHADQAFAEAVDAIAALKPEVVIAHLRKASLGGRSIANTQPFLSDAVSFCHNGTIDIPESLRGERSDSRVFFESLIAGGGTPEAFARLHAQFQAAGGYTAMNMLFSDGKKIIGIRDWNREHPQAEQLGFAKYYALFSATMPDCAMLCSEKLPGFSEETRAVENGEMCGI